MKTFVIQGVCTALSSISHNGGEKNGVTIQLRREKFAQRDGTISEVPVVSGNSIRGKIRDIAAIDVLTKSDNTKIQVDADSFNLLFSGGSLENVGSKSLDIEKVRKLREDIPMLSVLGCSVGNVIMPGQVDIGKLIPICKETMDLIPPEFHGDNELKTCWEYCQVEMNTRKDDTKDENKRKFIKKEDLTDELRGGQMMYHTETLIAGTRFFWQVSLRDTNEIETGAFLSSLQQWLNQSSQVGGNGRVGHGKLKFEVSKTKVVDSDIDFGNDDFVSYIENANSSKKDVSEFFEGGFSKNLFE